MCLFIQFTLKGAINKFGEDGENASLEEMQQLHDSSVFKPIGNNSVENRRNKPQKV